MERYIQHRLAHGVMRVAQRIEPRFLQLSAAPVLRIRECSGTQDSIGAGGLFLTLSELHKFGLFYLNKGKWNGKQLLNSGWIEESTRQQGEAPYGYLFWRGAYNSYRADGKYSQLSIVLPEKNAVVSVVAECRDGDTLMKYLNEDILSQL